MGRIRNDSGARIWVLSSRVRESGARVARLIVTVTEMWYLGVISGEGQAKMTREAVLSAADGGEGGLSFGTGGF